ncbi:methionine ABC transporter ATP-binding protein [Pleomorphomonas sp. PLEO]|uniref:methionine ABC transporter ATP-binding protein n=1 Tax=Pleomorphomonas sp. PLEO TaxID=3239306 RepID=UPI00351F3274
MNTQPAAAAFAAEESASGEFREPVVALSGVSRSFGPTRALDDLSLTVRRGEILGIIGRSGAGKSTLIRCLNGLERPDSGRIEIEGRDIVGLSEGELQPIRRKIGMIFQHFNLMSAKTVLDNVALPLKIAGWSKAKRRVRALELLDLVGLAEKSSSYPSALSGGQKQRVGIARALSARPALLLSDEATSALDPETTRSILALLKDINRKLGVTVVLITHEMEVVRTIGDRVAVIEAGRIIEEGEVWHVFSDPKTELTQSLLSGVRPQLPAHIASRLAPEGSEAVLGVDLTDPGLGNGLLSDILSRLPSAHFLHGGIDHIHDQPVARFFLTVPRKPVGLVDETTAYLRSINARVEVLGHVSRPV